MKKLLAILLTAALSASLLVLPVSALDSETFWSENAESLAEKGIFQYGDRPFREGLMPVLVNDQWNYMDDKGNVVDLNQNRFSYVFDFFEGLAAVIDKNTGKVGYINTSGNLVIPCRFGAYDSMGSIFVGYFHDGTATVLEQSTSSSPGSMVLKTIDKKGNLKGTLASTEDLTGLYLISDSGYMPDASYTEPTEPSLSFVVNKCTTAFGSFNPGFGEYVFSNGASYEAIATNHGAESISAHYALLSYCPEGSVSSQGPLFTGQIHFFDIDLKPGQSKNYVFSSVFSGLSDGEFDFLWVAFDNEQEKNAFMENVPYSSDDEKRLLDADRGAAWMKANFGIDI